MKHRPTQMEFGLDLGTEGPLEPVEVTDGELARTVAGLRERGLEVFAMDIRRGSYLLHLRRAPAPPVVGTLPFKADKGIHEGPFIARDWPGRNRFRMRLC